MKRIWILLNNEIKMFFTSVRGYFCLLAFSILAGYFYYYLLDHFYAQNLVSTSKGLDWASNFIEPYFENLAVVLILIIPLLTMRSFSEEYRERTDELLFSVPLTNSQIVIAKWLSCEIIILIMVVSTLVYPLYTLKFFQLDWAQLFCGYMGLVLFTVPLIFLGNFFSSLTENQVVSSLMSISVFLFLWLIKYSNYFLEPGVWDFVVKYSIAIQLQGFSRGIMDVGGVYYFLILTILAFYLNLFGLEVKRQWE